MRGKTHESCCRLVTTAGYLLLAIILLMPVGYVTAGESKVESAPRIDKSLERVAMLVPARYERPKVFNESVASLFEIERPALSAEPMIKREAPAAAPSSAVTVEKGKDAARAAEGNKHGTSAK